MATTPVTHVPPSMPLAVACAGVGVTVAAGAMGTAAATAVSNEMPTAHAAEAGRALEAIIQGATGCRDAVRALQDENESLRATIGEMRSAQAGSGTAMAPLRGFLDKMHGALAAYCATIGETTPRVQASVDAATAHIKEGGIDVISFAMGTDSPMILRLNAAIDLMAGVRTFLGALGDNVRPMLTAFDGARAAIAEGVSAGPAAEASPEVGKIKTPVRSHKGSRTKSESIVARRMFNGLLFKLKNKTVLWIPHTRTTVTLGDVIAVLQTLRREPHVGAELREQINILIKNFTTTPKDPFSDSDDREAVTEVMKKFVRLLRK